jgi:uroporphyrinogen-III synthase
MDRGGLLDEVDLIHREPLAAETMTQALEELGYVEWVVVTSPYTVQALKETGLESILTMGVQLAAVGPSTAQVLSEHGLTVDLIPPQESSGAALAEAFLHGTGVVLIPGATQSVGTVEVGLRAKGWTVISLPVYETTQAAVVDPSISTRWDEGEYEVFIATSPSTARAAAHLLGPSVPVVAIGPSSYAAAQDLGFPRVELASSTNPADLAAACIAITDIG